jgi:hypothetical protein
MTAKNCWPKPWIDAAVSAGFAHDKGNGVWAINDGIRDNLAAFAVSIAEHAEQEQREELAQMMERQHAWISNVAAANLIRKSVEA